MRNINRFKKSLTKLEFGVSGKVYSRRCSWYVRSDSCTCQGASLILPAIDRRWAILPFNSCCMKPCWRSWRKDVHWIGRATMEWLLLRFGHSIGFYFRSILLPSPSNATFELIKCLVLVDISSWCFGKTRSYRCDVSSFSC